MKTIFSISLILTQLMCVFALESEVPSIPSNTSDEALSCGSKCIIVIGAGVSGKICAYDLRGLFPIFVHNKMTLRDKAISGLSAAYLLQKHKKDVIVLEASNRFGGRVLSLKGSRFGYTDVGAAYIGPTQDHLLRMIQDLNLQDKLYDVYDKNNVVYFMKDKRIVTSHDGKEFSNTTGFQESTKFLELMDKIGETIPADEPWKAPNAVELDRMTFADFIKTHCNTSVCEAAGSWHVQSSLVCEPYEVSALFVLWFTKQAGKIQKMNAISGGAQQAKLQGGLQQVPEEIAKKLGKSRVRLNCVVVGVSHTLKAVTAQCADGRRFSGKHLIVAMSPSLMNGIHFTPSLGAARNQFQHRTFMGSVWKLEAFYTTPFWRKMNYSGLVETLDRRDMFISFLYDDSKANGTRPALIGFVVGREARDAIRLTKKERRKKFISFINEAFNTTRAKKYVVYIEHTMMAEPFLKGCYITIPHIGTMTDFKDVIRKSIGRIHFGGTETAWHWSGYVSGAIQGGERAAKEILYEEGDIRLREVTAPEPRSNVRNEC